MQICCHSYCFYNYVFPVTNYCCSRLLTYCCALCTVVTTDMYIPFNTSLYDTVVVLSPAAAPRLAVVLSVPTSAAAAAAVALSGSTTTGSGTPSSHACCKHCCSVMRVAGFLSSNCLSRSASSLLIASPNSGVSVRIASNSGSSASPVHAVLCLRDYYQHRFNSSRQRLAVRYTFRMSCFDTIAINHQQQLTQR
jgi:hypothetical protein